MTDKKDILTKLAILLDPGSFMELGENIKAAPNAFCSGEDKEAGDGVLTGFATIGERPVYIYAQNGASMGGSIGKKHAEKILRMYDMALKMHTPVIGLFDCSGVRLDEGSDSLECYAKILKAQSDAKGIIPQFAVVCGMCAGLTAVLASGCDFVYLASGSDYYICPPDARLQEARALSCDFCGDFEEVCEALGELYAYLPLSHEDEAPKPEEEEEEYCSCEDCESEDCDGCEDYEDCESCEDNECFEEDDLNRDCIGLGVNCDPAEIFTEAADDCVFIETGMYKGEYAVTGFIRLGGNLTGCAANASDVLSAESLEKLADFTDFCSSFNIPLLTLCRGEGFSREEPSEKALASSAAYYISASASARVPKVSLIYGDTCGACYSILASKGLGADFSFAYEGVKLSAADEELAARLLFAKEIEASADKAAALEEKKALYAEKAGLNSFLENAYVDKLMDPSATRRYLIGAFSMLEAKEECC